MALLLVLPLTRGHAVLTIEITEGVEGALPIAVVPFAWDGQTVPPQDIAQIISDDLARSGQFGPLARSDLLATPQSGADVRYANWKASGVDHLVIGRLRAMGPGAFVVQFQLFDVFKETQLVGYSFPATAEQLRQVAHSISDIIYEKITGTPGAFNTRIAYVSALVNAENQRRYVLQVSDADGHNPKTVLSSEHPLMSPSWSPDGNRLAYVSFEKRNPAIYVQTIKTAQREKISASRGINGAPVWSPDGTRLALTLSHKGSPDIFVLNIGTRRLQQITRSRAIETEPAWMPDGRSLVFTSDRSGAPQLYQQSLDGGRARRLTFEGKYNASATVSADGARVAMVHGDKGRYRIAVLDRDTGALRVVTDGTLDESPSFAPNGSMIIYATHGTGRGVLGAVSVDGRMKQRFSLAEGDVREPVWSPFSR
ncbi:MAG: Tol-Pal system beta propeller repeat protein TolB [Gammaproteobacteria bacterium]|nr:Tol-Pal system beta propeller repeat protein TolB [Gammaproteobacteria bacterium]